MSLDVYLRVEGESVPRTGSGIFIRENGQNLEITAEEWNRRNPDREPVKVNYDEDTTDTVFDYNITHNLGRMAGEACCYKECWHPDECEPPVTHAVQMILPLATAFVDLQARPEHYKQFNPENMWGDYDGFVRFVAEYLTACIRWPNATVHADA